LEQQYAKVVMAPPVLLNGSHSLRVVERLCFDEVEQLDRPPRSAWRVMR
jgi:hypothetical protein